MKTRNLVSIIILLSAGSIASLFAASKEQAPVTPKAQSSVQITADREGVLPANQKLSFTANVTPPVGCSDLKIKVYGVDGVQVYGQSEKSFASCTGASHSVEILIPSKTAGLTVVQVTYKNSRGEPRSAVKPFVAKTADAPQVKSKIGTKMSGGGSGYTILPSK